MKRLFAFLVLILLALPSAGWAQRVDQLQGMPGAAASSSRIAAVVNDNVISTSDVNDRTKLAILSAGLPDTTEVRQRLLLQILRGLMDEQLQMQEAKRLDVTVSKEEIDQALDHVAKDNHIDGDMRTFITSHGGSPEALISQIRATLSWTKVVQRELRPRVEVGDDEVDAVIERMRANAGKEEYLVSEIFLAVDAPKDDDQVKQFAENLVQQIKGGANFAAVARQFSQGTGAATGGDIGWIQEGQLPQELNHVLTSMQPTQIEGPIRSTSGYHILGLREKRTITLGGDSTGGDVRLNLQQVFRPTVSEDDKQAADAEASRLRMTITSCTNLQSNVTEKFPAWHWNNLGDVEMSKAPPFVAEKVHDLSVGQASEPIETDKGDLIMFVCERHVPDSNINREEIVNSIGTEKLELQARRLLRDLRRDAYIDLRLSSAPS